MPNGNILFKTGVGNFSYNEDVRPHAVTEVENVDGKIPGSTLYTSFNDFGKIQLIEDAGKNLRMNFTYGPDQERWSSKLSRNSMDIRTTVYAGEYEKITERGITREFYYLDGNAIAIREDGTTNIYLAFTDNLGSILSVMNEKGKKVFDASYDAWGQQTVTLNDIDLHRGYTGHEMLTEFDIINMNGRLYDPVLGRFFNPDNYVQLPDNSQSFNRYSYCLNNPLKYTDPTGEFWNLIIGATIGGLFNWAAHDFQYNGNGLKYFAVGALAGAVSAGVASGVNVAMAGGNFWTGAAGVAEGDVLQGAIQGMMIGALNHAQHDPTNNPEAAKVRSRNRIKKDPKYKQKIISEIQKDGKLSFEEAFYWYGYGDGSDIYVDASKLDLGRIDITGKKLVIIGRYKLCLCLGSIM